MTTTDYPDYTFTVITDQQKLAKLGHSWCNLYNNCDNPCVFLSWEFVSTYLNNCTKPIKPWIILVYRADILVAVLPLKKVNTFIGTQALPLLDTTIADYADILSTEPAPRLLPVLFAYVTCHCRHFKFPMCLQSSVLAQNINTVSHTYQHIICDNPVINLTDNFAQYYETRKKGLRQEIRTTVNKLNRLGNWSFNIAASTTERKALFASLVAFHQTRQTQKAGLSLFDSLEQQQLMQIIALEPSLQNRVHLSAILLNNKVISSAICLLANNMLHYWIPSFDPEYSKMSIGKLHIKCLVEHAFDQQLSCFDFMGGNETYKYQWATGSEKIVALTYYGMPGLLILYKIKQRLVLGLKSVKNRSRLLQTMWRLFSKAKGDFS